MSKSFRDNRRCVFGCLCLALSSILLLSGLGLMVSPVVAQNLTITLDTDTGTYVQGELATFTFSYAPNAPILLEVRDSTNQPVFAWEDTMSQSGNYVFYLNTSSIPPGQYVLHAKAGQTYATKTFSISQPFISVNPPRALKADFSNTAIPTPIYYYFNGSAIRIATEVFAPNDHFTLTVNATSIGLGYLNYTASQANSTVFPYGSGKLYRFTINLTVPNNYSQSGGQPIHFSATGPFTSNYTNAFIAVLNINPREDPTLGLAGSTTDFRTVEDFTNITNLTFEKFVNSTSIGKIVFLEPINLCDMNTVNALLNLGNNLNVALAKMSMNTAADALAAMNKSSALYMYNLPFDRQPGILKDGAPVVLSGQTSGGPVISLSWDNSTKTLQFNVTHWTTYEADGQPPAITPLSPTPGATVTTGTPTISASFSDNVAVAPQTAVVKVDGADVAATVTASGFTYTPSVALGDGTHTVYVSVNDTVGNQGISSWSFTVSIPAPAPAPAPAPPPAPAPTPVSGTTATITLSVVANTPATVDITAQAPASSLTTVEILTNQSIPSVQLTTSEYSENPTSTPLPSTVTPVSYIKIETNIPAGAVTQATIKFRVPKSTISLLSLDPSSVQLYRLDTTWSALSTAVVGQDGNYYYYEAVSPGFSYFAIAGKPLVAESVPPTISSFSPEGTVTEKRPTITVKYYDNVAIDVTSIRLLLDNVDVTALATVNSTTLTYKPTADLSEGTHSLYFEVKDTSGNKASKSWSINISIPVADTTPPVISALTPADGALLRNATVTISAAYSDNVAIDVSSVVLKLDNVAVTPTKLTSSGVEYTTTLSDGAHTVSLTVKDTSGNAATATWSFTVSVPIDYTPYIFGILILIIVVAAVVVLTSKRKR
jgi:PGF-pre-PGF domain-containing protein